MPYLLTMPYMWNGVNEVAFKVIRFNDKNNEKGIIYKCSSLKAYTKTANNYNVNNAYLKIKQIFL